MRFLLIIGTFVWCTMKCTAVPVEDHDSGTADETNHRASRDDIDKINNYALEWYKHKYEINPYQAPNLVSLNGIFGVFSTFTYDQDENVENKLRQILEIPFSNGGEIRNLFQTLVAEQTSFEKNFMNSTRGLFYRDGYVVESKFQNVLQTKYHFEVGNYDPNIPITDDSPDIYFSNHATLLSKASLLTHTQEINFQCSNDQPPVQLPIISGRGNFNRGDLTHLDATFIEIILENVASDSTIRMFVILPNSLNGFEDLRKNINLSTIEQLLDSTKIEGLYVELPVLKFYSTDYYQEFIETNFTHLFTNAPNSNKIGIMDHDNIVVEAGNESPSSDDVKYGEEKFIADRPFVFIITSMDENPLIHFIGDFPCSYS